jgi:protein SCO1/2
MTTTRLLAALLVTAAVAIGFARSRTARDADTAGRTYEVAGVVTIAPAAGRMTVAHETIPGYMPAMTMPFTIGRGGAPQLAPGDRVRFTFRVTADASYAENIRIVGRDARVAAGAGETAVARARLKKGDVLPAFSLIDESGRAFTGADLRGRRTAVTFVFTRCPVPDFCPRMVKQFQAIQRALAEDRGLDDVRLLSVTLDPGFDTPPILAAYAKAMGADPARWRFVTGDAADVAALTTAFSIHTERNGVLLDHTLATALIGADGRALEIWRGNGWKAEEVLAKLQRAD